MTSEEFWWFLTALVLGSSISSASVPVVEKDRCPPEAIINSDSHLVIIDVEPGNAGRVVNVTDHGLTEGNPMRAPGACPCPSRACIALCCPQGHVLYGNECVPMTNDTGVKLSGTFDSLSLEPLGRLINSSLNASEGFHLFEWDPCPGEVKWRLNSKVKADEFKILDNGSIYTVRDQGVVDFQHYCLAYLAGETSYSVVQCFDMDYDAPPDPSGLEMASFMPIGFILSVPGFFATFIVYSILPELNNLHGLILRAYVGQSGFTYVAIILLKLVPCIASNPITCASFAFIVHFSFLSSFFWLNVMCFDIWWTFGGFRALQGSVKQRERKKFIMYSVYAWGCASSITGVGMIMDFVPYIPDDYIKPRFGEPNCWFPDEISKAVYFYGPMGTTITCNIVLFISTAIKIVQHKRDTALQLKGIDSHRHDDHKQWFNLYLKLFIVMGINWSMEILSWLLTKDTPAYIWYITDLANTLQGVIIFIIFVWKAKIRRLLMKRFGCQKEKFQSGNSTRSGCHSSGSNKTCTSIALHDKIPVERNRTNTATDESDCV